MALLSARTYIYLISAFHLFVAYLLMFSPVTVEKQTYVLLIGKAMGMWQTSNFANSSSRSATAFLAMSFAYTAFSDIVAAGMDEVPYRIYWASQAPVRLSFFFLLTGYTYIFRNSASKSSGLEALKCGVVFCWAFGEVLAWYWIYSTLREEKAAAAANLKAEAAME